MCLPSDPEGAWPLHCCLQLYLHSVSLSVIHCYEVAIMVKELPKFLRDSNIEQRFNRESYRAKNFNVPISVINLMICRWKVDETTAEHPCTGTTCKISHCALRLFIKSRNNSYKENIYNKLIQKKRDAHLKKAFRQTRAIFGIIYSSQTKNRTICNNSSLYCFKKIVHIIPRTLFQSEANWIQKP